MLYTALLQAQDPRRALIEIRNRLHALYGDQTHDWASLLVYAALPTDLLDQLTRFRYQQTRAALEAALGNADDVLGRTFDREAYERTLARVKSAADALPRHGEYRIETLGLRGAAWKRLSNALFRQARDAVLAQDRETAYGKSIEHLRESQREYDLAGRESLRHRPDEPVQVAAFHWVLTQVVGLSKILDGRFDRAYWDVANLSATTDARSASAEKVVLWGYSSLVELHLLRAWDQPGLGDLEKMDACGESFILRAPPSGSPEPGFAVASTARQLRRYVNWWWSEEFRTRVAAVPPVPEDLRAAVKKLAERLEKHR
jgi:hypothetical protein